MSRVDSIRKPGNVTEESKEFYSNLRNLIKNEKERLSLTNVKISEISGVHRPSIANFLNGKLDYLSFHNALKILVAINNKEAINLAKILNVPTTETRIEYYQILDDEGNNLGSFDNVNDAVNELKKFEFIPDKHTQIVKKIELSEKIVY